MKMIEVLAGDKLLEQVNTTGKKITIKYYLNDSLKPLYFDDLDAPYYRLYIRVIFNRQSIKIRSYSNFELKEKWFNELNNESLYLLKREALTIAHYLSSNYYEYNPDNPYSAQDDEFNLSEVFETFNYNDHSIVNFVERYLEAEVIAEIQRKGQDKDALYLTVGHFQHNPFQLLKFLQSTDKSWLKFEDKFDKKIWFFAMLHNKFAAKSDQYRTLDATLIDAKLLTYAAEFTEFYKNEDVTSVTEFLQNLAL